MNLIKLRKEIQRAGYSYSDMGKKLGITRSAFSKKMSGVNEFKTSQVYEIKEILNLSAEDMNSIFFLQSDNTEEQGSISGQKKRNEAIEKAQFVIVTKTQIEKLKELVQVLKSFTEMTDLT